MTAEADAAGGSGPAKMKDLKKLSKRQKRKQPSEKNKWPQHPKIQNMEVRSKAYIRVAGFGPEGTKKKKKESAVDPKLDLMSPEVKFGRLLGGTDQRKRHAAVQKLKAYLKARCDISNENGGISEMDLLKLWKGLWYTLYMADKVPVQDELSKRLAELLWCVAGTEEEDEYAGQAYMDMSEAEEKMQDDDFDDEDVELEEIENTLEEESEEDEDSEGEKSEDNDNDEDSSEMEEDEEEDVDHSEIPHCRGAHLASLFIRTFFRTVKREWGNMDKYRIDKFYSLTRMYLHEVFKYMATRHWNLGIIRMFNDAMFEEVLNQRPNGLRYHLIDIALDELAKVNASAPMPLTEATFLDTLEPYFAMCQTGAGGDNSVQQRVMDNVLEKFLMKYSVVGESADRDDVDDRDENSISQNDELVLDQAHVGSIAQFIFELASDPETKDQYRKSLYDMHKTYMRRLKKIGKDVLLDENEEDMDFEEGDYIQDSDQDVNQIEPSKVILAEDESSQEMLTPTKDKKQKKKRKKSSENDSGDKVLVDSKQEKKKRKASKNSSQEPEDEVITISLSEQNEAKSKRKKQKQKQEKEREEEEKMNTTSASSEEKRVKWKPVNRSKSYKASVKALSRASPPKTSQVTPEKSILRSKGRVRRADVKKKAGRKKGVNYF